MLADIKKYVYRGEYMSVKSITSPLSGKVISELKAGERILLSGTFYTARDAAHKRMADLVERGEGFPFNIKGQTIYYVGPTPAQPGHIIGSAGPTTSGRMDKYTPTLLNSGLKTIIGKGYLGEEVVESIKKNKAVYLAAIGGLGALISRSIKHMEVIAYEDLGPEAIYKLTVEDFPAIVIVDCFGDNWYEIGRDAFK